MKKLIRKDGFLDMQISARDRQYRKIKQGSVYQFMRDLFSDDTIRIMLQKRGSQQGQGYLSKNRDCWMQEMMDSFDSDLRKNPYSVSPYTTISLRDLDARLLELPSKHPYHVKPDSQSRVDQYLMTELNRSVREQVSSVLPYQKVMQDTWTVLLDNTPEKYQSQQFADRLSMLLINAAGSIYSQVDVNDGLAEYAGVIPTEWLKQNLFLSAWLITAARQYDHPVDDYDFNNHLALFAKETGMQLDNEQTEVVRSMLTHHVTVLTGFAGVGKTTLLRAVVNYLKDHNRSITVTASVGRACFNLYNQTHIESRPIASHLYRGQAIGTDYLIIDEASMVGEDSLASLLSLVDPIKTSLILLGDQAQLPAVRTIGVLTGLLPYLKHNQKLAELLNYHNLTHVYRQDEQSRLLRVATAVRQHAFPRDLHDESGDISLKFRQGTINSAVRAYEITAKKFGVDSTSAIALTNKDVNDINQALQTYYLIQNNGKDSLKLRNGRRFVVGDKVLVTSNSYNLEDYAQHPYVFKLDDAELIKRSVYNGFLGRVVKVIKANMFSSPDNPDFYAKVVVEFQDANGDVFQILFVDQQDKYQAAMVNKGASDRLLYGDLDNLDLGYALTVHKVQGTTIPHVIFYLNRYAYPSLRTRQMMYTALTRASETCLFLTNGQLKQESLMKSVNNSTYTNATSFFGPTLLMAINSDKDVDQRPVDPKFGFYTETGRLRDVPTNSISEFFEKMPSKGIGLDV